jgi:rhodanese-related sulfurtransferase
MHKIITAVSLLCFAACAKAPETSPEPAVTPAAEAKAVEATTTTAALEPAAADPHAGLAKLEVDEVARLLEEKKIVAVDSNGADTRKELGTLPGAVLLTSSRTYELSELPADKSTELVFYCGSEKCSAAPKAAARATEAGYTAVKVMPAGISGWVKAGKPVEQS